MPGVLTRKTRTARGKLASSTTSATVTTSRTKLSKLQAGKETQTPAPFTARSANIEIVLPSRKRKVQDDDEPASKKLCREPEAPITPSTPVSRKKKSVRFAEPAAAPSTPSRAPPTTPSSSRKRRFDSDETGQAEALLERLNIQSPVSKRNKTTVHRRAPQNDYDLPRELVDLLDLHAAFLTTLQYSLSGAGSPIDLRTLYASVTRTWGKRHVTADDIQRCIGVLSWTPVKTDGAAPRAPFFLCDYGRDKLCIELHPSAERGPLREAKLNMDFEANLRTLWLSSRDTQPAAVFIATLPKAPIKAAAHKAINPLLATAKTQTTLDAFKRAIAEKRQQEQEAKAAATAAIAQAQPTTTTTTSTENGPKISLLDRIRAKETLLAAPQANTPSPAELQRRHALQRAADVAAVVGMLCKATAAGQARVSFTMAALMVRLKDSMRTPISQEDGMVCVRLLAAEVAPRWLRVVKVGGRENVVCEVGFQPAKGEVEARVGGLMGSA
jgi:hypothetical protein